MKLTFSGTIKQVGATLLQQLSSLTTSEKHSLRHVEAYGTPMWDDGLHPDYGLPKQYRVDCVVLAEVIGVTKAAKIKNVSKSSIYNWRKSMENTNARLYQLLSR